MIDRTRFKWDCVLADETDGSPVDRVFESYWSPDYIAEGNEGTLFVAEACAAEASLESKRKGKQRVFRPISAQLAEAA